MLQDLRESFKKEISNIKKETENIKTNQSEMKNMLTEIKGILDGINSRLDGAMDPIRNLEDKIVENNQNRGGKKNYKDEDNFRDLWNNINQAYQHFYHGCLRRRGQRERDLKSL